MSRFIPYIVVFAVGMLVCWYLMRGCDNRNIGAIQSQLDVSTKKSDSLVKRSDSITASNDSIKAKNTHDSIVAAVKIDSQSVIIKKLQGRYEVAQGKVSDLTTQLRTYYLAQDTSNLFKTYDSLQNELTILNNAYFGVQISRDSLDSSYKEEVERLNGVIKETQSNLLQFKMLFATEVMNNKTLTDQVSKSLRKERARNLWGNIQKGLVVIAGFVVGRASKK